MAGRNAFRAVDLVGDDEEINVVTMERFERRLGEECGLLRIEIVNLRTETADRSADLLKWLLAFFVAQTAAIAALMAGFR
jgi:hypothetical protein